MKNSTSKSKARIIIAAVLAAVLLVGAIVSIVIVLAAQTQNIQTNISINYVVDGVGAKASATYAMVPDDTTAQITRVSMTSGGAEEVAFNVNDGETDAQIAPTDNLTFENGKTKIVFEYMFENTAETAFSVELIETPATKTNMSERYLVSGTRLSVNDYRNKITNETLPAQAVTEMGSKIYVYVSAYVTNVNKGAKYEGQFTWALMSQNTIDVTLDTDGATRTLKVIPTTAVSGIMMPTIAPAIKDNHAFEGYYASANGTGTQYINSLGAGAHVADLAANTTIYASFNEAYTVEGTKLIALTDEGKALESVVVTDNITEIGANAFAGSQATSVTIPNTVTTIGESAFANNTNLQEVNIEPAGNAYADGEGLKTINFQAFYNCNKLIALEIPETVTTIENGILHKCDSLKKFILPNLIGEGMVDWNEMYPHSGFSRFFINQRESYDYDNGYCNLHESYIPQTLEEVIINRGGYSTIGKYAFVNCSDIKSITIPDTIKAIIFNEDYDLAFSSEVAGYGPFSGCGFLQVKNLSGCELWGFNPYEYTEILTSNVDFKSYYEYQNGYKYFINEENVVLIAADQVTKVVNNLREDTTHIFRNAFYGNKKITDVELPSNIITIGNNAFYNCSNLTNINIPSSVKFIESNVFDNCSGLSYYEYNDAFYLGNENNNLHLLCKLKSKNITNFNIPNGVVIIDSSVFSSCKQLTSITMPNSVLSIGSFAFAWCPKLETFDFSDNLQHIGTYAFSDCDSMTSITIPDSVTSLGTDIFRNCNNLTSAKLPSNIKNIPAYMFRGCCIEEINLPDSIVSIGAFALADIVIANDITLPNIKYIGVGAFAYASMSSLSFDNNDNLLIIDGSSGISPKNLILSDNLVYVGKNAFLDVNNITINITDYSNWYYNFEGVEYIQITNKDSFIDALMSDYELIKKI